MFDDLSYRQVTQGATGEFFGEADLNGILCIATRTMGFQESGERGQSNLHRPEGKDGMIPASAITCFNTEGTDWIGRPMHPEVNVGKGRVQPLWIGIQMPEHAGRGIYSGKAIVSDSSGASQEVKITINLSDNVLVDKGDSDLWRLSRLRWLNSQYAVNDQLVKPFIPMTVTDNTISVFGTKRHCRRTGVTGFHPELFHRRDDLRWQRSQRHPGKTDGARHPPEWKTTARHHHFTIEIWQEGRRDC